MDNQNRLIRFWHELKRRKVVRVSIVYASTAFILLQLISLLKNDTGILPDWVPTFFWILLLVGFPIVVILAWVFDITPQGVEVTPPIDIKTATTTTSHSRKKEIVLDTIIVFLLLIVFILAWPKIFKNNSVSEQEKSIAVLPLMNFSGDPNQDYMSSGLTDEIINHLYSIKSFDKIISLPSVLTFKDTKLQLPQIAAELNVNYILEGTYKKISDQIRVAVRLIKAKDDKLIWQNEYDQPYKEIINIQADVATNIADHLRIYMTKEEKQNIIKNTPENMEAYNLLLKASYIVNSGDTTTFGYNLDSAKFNAIFNLIKKAIELDPTYSNAYCGAGQLLIASANYGGINEMLTTGWDALYYFEKAAEIDAGNGFAHQGIAMLNDWFLWNYITAEKEFKKAISLLPGYDPAKSQYGEFLIKMNQLDDAEIIYKDLEPNFTIQYRKLRKKLLSENKAEAMNSIKEFLDTWKTEGYIWAGESYLWLEEYDSAYYYLNAIMPYIDPEIIIPRFQACMALANYKTGHTDVARSIVNQMEGKSKITSAMSPDFFTGWYFSGIGEKDSAFVWLEKAYKNRSAEMPWLKVDPIFKSLKNDDRYWDLYKRTGHAAYDEYLRTHH